MDEENNEKSNSCYYAQMKYKDWKTSQYLNDNMEQDLEKGCVSFYSENIWSLWCSCEIDYLLEIHLLQSIGAFELAIIKSDT